ncbi:hypothetical protein GCM10009117_00950 [Gangjinia marincola]|uniref:DUF2607 family protein n=1 Tax=Gangjinia marincola TaxID=578463 RepID=A0ABN1MD71_9FLAO
MKNIKIHILTSWLLVAVFALPTLQQALHALEGHTHTVCTDASVHLHQGEAECDLHDFQLNPVTYFPQENSTIRVTALFSTTHWNYLSTRLVPPFSTNPLRGPPQA